MQREITDSEQRGNGRGRSARSWPGLCALVLLGGLATESVIGSTARGDGPLAVFEDVSSLIDFRHGSVPFDGDGLAGAAWLDYDRDGRLDLFLSNGRTQRNGLFRNDGAGGFVDVSAGAGIENGRGNTGVVAADFDNDGFTDLFLNGDGGILEAVPTSPVVLYRNNGDGTFRDVTTASGIVGPPTGVSAAAADVDNDGFLDLYITAAGSLVTQTQHANRLYRNNRDWTFTDVSAAAGVGSALGALAALFSDYDGDGWIDLLVGNGNEIHFAPTPSELYRNRGDLTFANVAAPAGLAKPGYWMGFATADYDSDGTLDLFVTNLGADTGNPHALYRGNGDGTYTDVAAAAGAADFPFAWGCAFKDFDNDGHADLFFAGALPGLDANPGVFLFNDGRGRFTDRTASSPIDLRRTYPSGVASGDYDGDGFEDLVIMQEAEPGRPVLLRNRGNGNNWVATRLEGRRGNRGAVGARVTVSAGGRRQAREVYAGSSFASTDSPWLTFGLGRTASVDHIEVRWPSGPAEVFRCVAPRRLATLVEGTGPASCAGDCDADGAVTVSELVFGLAIALGNAALAGCPVFDVDGDGQVVVDELLRAVRRALGAAVPELGAA